LYDSINLEQNQTENIHALFNPLKTGFHLNYKLNFSCCCTENTLCDHQKD